METLYDKSGADLIIGRINQLTPESTALWGKMTVAQMLAHCQAPLRVAFGDLVLKRGFFGFLFGGMAKKKLLADAQFDRNLPTDPNFKIREKKDFEKEKHELIKMVTKIAEKGPTGITSEPHPFFGKMTPEQWDALLWKHLDHHLRQFGV